MKGRLQPRLCEVVADEATDFASSSTPGAGSLDPKPSVHAKSQEGFSNSDQTAAGSVAGPELKMGASFSYCRTNLEV